MSHALGRPYPERVKVREPVARPLDVVAAELLLSASQAFLVGVLVYLAMGVWDDRGVSFGPVAIVVAGLGIAVGAGWLYWLLGGVGWPLAAANVPTAMLLGFALILGWQGDDLFRIEGVPLVLSLAASVYGIACGVFLDSPRRLRWDQRQKPRQGAAVPRVSPTTRRAAAQVPRSLPRRPTTTLQEATELAPSQAGPEAPGSWSGSGTGGPGGPSVTSSPDDIPWSDAGRGSPSLDDLGAGTTEGSVAAGDPDESPSGRSSVPDAAPAAGLPADEDPRAGDAAVPAMPTERLEQAARKDQSTPPTSPTSSPGATVEPGGIELPTSVEPKAQRSPWAWAAPPEWTRDEDDEPPRGRSASRR